jgi:hypothetical protein
MEFDMLQLIAMAALGPVAGLSAIPSARDIRGPSPLVAIENEPPPKLIVDPPLAEQLANGLVFIQYRTENLRIIPVFGKGALDVSPRVGHVHITVVGLKPGPHKVLFELADPTHRVIASETVQFTIPAR